MSVSEEILICIIYFGYEIESFALSLWAKHDRLSLHLVKVNVYLAFVFTYRPNMMSDILSHASCTVATRVFPHV